MSTATTISHEFRREVSSGRAAIPEAASWLLDLHHQCRPESSGSGLRGRWMQVHPNYHEGLRVTAGTRYIMISFVDPW